MAKKDKKSKKDDKTAEADPVEAVRSAVERTFQATAERAAGTQKRTRELVDEVANAAARIREAIEDRRVLDDLKAIRDQLDELSRRVAALEAADGKAAKPAASRSRRTTAASSKASTPARPAAAKTRSTASRAKSSGTKSTGTRARSTSSRSTSSRSGSSGTGSPTGGS
jgi:hypothetical protein